MSSDNLSRIALMLGMAACILALIEPGSFYVQVMIWAAFAAVLAICMRFVMLVGEFNLATGAFYGIGAYAAGYLTVVQQWPLIASIIAAGVVVAIVAAALGYLTMRTTGAYFMLISFAFSEIVRLVFVETPALGGNNGILGVFVPLWLEPYFPAIVIFVCIALIVALHIVERSPLGKIFKAIKNKEDVAKSVGIDVLSVRVLALVLASVAAGIAGALYAHVTTVITPGDFSYMLAVFALAYVKLGGEDHPTGAVFGAVSLTLLGQWVLQFGTYDQLFYGAIMVLAMLALPKGVLGRLEQLGIVRSSAPIIPKRHGVGQ